MEPVIDEAAELDSNVPKMLCQLDNHLGKSLLYFELFKLIKHIKYIYIFFLYSMCKLCKMEQ